MVINSGAPDLRLPPQPSSIVSPPHSKVPKVFFSSCCALTKLLPPSTLILRMVLTLASSSLHPTKPTLSAGAAFRPHALPLLLSVHNESPNSITIETPLPSSYFSVARYHPRAGPKFSSTCPPLPIFLLLLSLLTPWLMFDLIMHH